MLLILPIVNPLNLTGAPVLRPSTFWNFELITTVSTKRDSLLPIVKIDITIKAEYIPDNTGELPVTEGSIIYFKSEKFPRMDSEFSSAPKIKYSYTTNEGHETSVNQKTLTKINKNSKSDYCGTRWKGKVQLFDRKELKKALKQGVSTRDFLLQHPQKPLTLTYSVTALNSNKEECSTTRKVSLVPPEMIHTLYPLSTAVLRANPSLVFMVLISSPFGKIVTVPFVSTPSTSKIKVVIWGMISL